MFFGLFNILASFQRYVNKILAKKLEVFCNIVAMWPITWSYLLSFYDILLNLHSLTILLLLTFQYIKLHPSIIIEILHWWGVRLLVLLAIILLQFRSLFTNISLLGLTFSIFKTIQETNCSTKSYNWRRYKKQNQPRILLVWRTWLLFINTVPQKPL